MSLYKKGNMCLGWFNVKPCHNMQSDEAENGLCDNCEIDRRKHITEQLEGLVKGMNHI